MFKKRFIGIGLLFIFSCLISAAQTTSVTATITDSDGIIWTNAKWRVLFVPNPSQPNQCTYQLSGQSICSNTWKQYLDQSGTSNSVNGLIAVTLLDNTQITPSGSQFVWTVQSNTSAPATQYLPLTISGASENLTSFLSVNSTTPRFPALGLNSWGYSDSEVSPTPNPGNFYFNVTTQTSRTWDGTQWTVFANGCSTCVLKAGDTMTGSLKINTAQPSWSTSTSAIVAGCDFAHATGDTRCYPDADFSSRMNDCLNTNKPSNQICDGSSELNPVINTTINVADSSDLKLPPITITCNVTPCIEANAINNFSILGSSHISQGRTAFNMTVHGPAILLTGSIFQAEVGQFFCNYGPVTGNTPSSFPEDKCVVVSGGLSVSPRDLKIHDITDNYGYDNVFDGNCSAGTNPGQCHSFTFSGTNSNVIKIENVKGWHLGNADVSFGLNAGVHDQLDLNLVGCDGTVNYSGLGCIYINATNNLTIGQVWVWHINDSGINYQTGGTPANFVGLNIESTATCKITSIDLEANYLLGNANLIDIAASNCTIDSMSSYFNNFGGSGGAGASQAYLRGATNAKIRINNILNNNTNSDVCTATGSTVDAFYNGASGVTLKIGQPLKSLAAMPSGTNCTPVVVSNWGSNIQEDIAYISSTSQNNYSMFDDDLTVKANSNYPQIIDFTNMYGTSAPIQFDPNGGIAPMFTDGSTFSPGDIPQFNSPDGHLRTYGYNSTHQIPANFVVGTANNYSVTWTPSAATASQCVEQTVTVTGIVTGEGLGGVTPPNSLGTHIWIGAIRVTASNTIGVSFCADATGGTPPTGIWYFRQ